MELLARHFGKLMLLFFGSTLFITSIYSGTPAEAKLQTVSGTLQSVSSHNGSNATRYTEIKLEGNDLTFYYGTQSQPCGNMHDKLVSLKLKPLTIKYASSSGLSGAPIHVVYDTWSGKTPICPYAEIAAKRQLKDQLSFYLGLAAILVALAAMVIKKAP
jgi:hypothetical protein